MKKEYVIKTKSMIKMNTIKLPVYMIAALLIALLSSGCEKWRCIKGEGAIISETRDIEYFDGIITDGIYEVFLEQDTSISADSMTITITTNENLLPYISTERVANDLVITSVNDRCLKTKDYIQVYVTVKDLEFIENAGSGFIKCTERLEAPEMRIYATGSGDIVLQELYISDKLIASMEGSGEISLVGESAKDADYFVSGSGDIFADFFKCQTSVCDVPGSGDVFVYVEELLAGEITGSGNIYFRGAVTRGVRVDLLGTGGVFAIGK